jgi:hypothetical protein
MKSFVTFVFLYCCFTTVGVLAQTPKSIEEDLLRSINKIQEGYNSNFVTPKETDPNVLDAASNQLEKKIIYYGKKYPSFIGQVFKKIGGLSSDDGLFNIFSWDTYMGGTQHVFQAVILYRSNQNANFSADTTLFNNANTDDCDKLYTLKIGDKNYYVITYYQILDLHARGEGIKILSIDDDKLNVDVKIIKTQSGLTNKLHYNYEQTDSNADIMGDATLEYDPKSKTITFPVVITNGYDGELTENYITYKLTGQYFERVKN